MRKEWIFYILCALVGLAIGVSAYSTYGAPSEFGNDTTTTCWVGGDYGEVICDSNVTTAEFCLTGDSCISTWPSGGGGSGDKWVDAGSYIYPNTTYADNIIIPGYIRAFDWSNFTGTESQITDLSHTAIWDSIFNNTGDSRWSSGDGNASSICSNTEVLLGNGSCQNSTLFFDDTDTTYTAGSNMSLIGTIFSVNMTQVKDYFDGIYQAVGNYLTTASIFTGEVSGTYNNIVLDNDALDDQYVELTDLPLSNQTSPYCGNITGATSNLCTLVDTDTTIADTNASSICSSDEVLLGNGTCMSSSGFGGSANGYFYNVTTGLHTGDLTYGGYTGYEAGNKICDSNFTGTHLCTQTEIMDTIQAKNISAIPEWTGTFYESSGGAKYAPADLPVNDCNGWTHGASGNYLGSFWLADSNKGGVAHCGNERVLACCKNY